MAQSVLYATQTGHPWAAVAELRPVEDTVVKAQTLSEWAEANKDALKPLFK